MKQLAVAFLLLAIVFIPKTVFAQGPLDDEYDTLTIDEKMSSLGYEMYENSKSTVTFATMKNVNLCEVQARADRLADQIGLLRTFRDIFLNTMPNKPIFLKEWRNIFMDLKLSANSHRWVITQINAIEPIDKITLSNVNWQTDMYLDLVDEVILELLGPDPAL